MRSDGSSRQRETGDGQLHGAWLLYSSMALLSAAVAFATPLVLAAQQPSQTAPQSGWIPFVAKAIEQNTMKMAGVPYTLEVSGIYARNSHGSWYREMNTEIGKYPLSPYRPQNYAQLFQAGSQTLYFLDLVRKRFRVENRDGNQTARSGSDPISRSAFDQSRAEDKFLGKQTVSGFECEVYAIHDAHKKGKYAGQVWYAPSLNFLPVKTRTSFEGGQDVITLVEDIHAGEEPNPQYFIVPEGFKK